jgi:hypothetical protein
MIKRGYVPKKRFSAFSESYPRFIQTAIQKDKTRIWAKKTFFSLFQHELHL